MLRKPRILLYDIETSPNEGYTWGKWKQNVIKFTRERAIISIAWKWLDEPKVYVMSVPVKLSSINSKVNNRKLMVAFQKVRNQADVSVAHNGDPFDGKLINTELLKNGLPPCAPIPTVDTLKVARKYFRFNDNSLNALAKLLGLGSKVHHYGFELWVRFLAGNRAARMLMEKYNKGDVVLLEKVFKKERPWMESYPFLREFEGCDICGGRMQRRGERLTKSGGWKRRYQCIRRGCGHWQTERK
jgi:DNA polymerase elongation subunit (family B)